MELENTLLRKICRTKINACFCSYIEAKIPQSQHKIIISGGWEGKCKRRTDNGYSYVPQKSDYRPQASIVYFTRKYTNSLLLESYVLIF